MRPTSLKQQLLIACMLPAALAACLISAYLYATHSIALRNQLIDTGKVLTQQLAHQSLPLLQQSNHAALDQLARNALDAPQVRSVTVLDNAHRVITQLGPATYSTNDIAIPTNAQNSSVINTGDSWLIVSPIANHELQGWLVIEFSTLYLQVQNFQQLFTSLIIIAAVLLLAVWLTHRYFRGHIASWQQLVTSVQRLTRGQPLSEPGNVGDNDFAVMENSMRELSVALQTQQQEYEQHIEQSMHDLRETLETIEIQNIELDLARREAVQASKMKSEFLANTSHEIRTPLNGIVGFTRLLARTSLSPQQRDYLDTIRQSSESLLTLINDILDLSKMEAGKFALDHTVFSLADLTEQTLAILAPGAQEKGLELLQITDMDVPEQFSGDAQRMRQVLTNLLSNAIKFTENGSVTLHISRKTDSTQSPVIKFSVVDTGIGLPYDRQQDIFQAFTQLDAGNNRQYGGSGLGLAICKKLIEQMGGDIGINSEEHKGSTFWFTLKLDVAAAGDVDSTNNSTPAPLPQWEHTPLALVVDDNATNLRLLKMLLTDMGLNVLEASSGSEAIAQCQLQRPDIIFMDIQMPSMDGLEATQRIHQLNHALSSVPIVAVTAHAQPEQKQLFLQGGMNAYLSKPIHETQLAAVLRQFLGVQTSPLAGNTLTAGLIDAHHYHCVDRELAIRLCFNKPELARDMLNGLLRELPEVDALLQVLIAQQEWSALQEQVHRLHGACSYCGVPELKQACANFETAYKTQQLSELHVLALLTAVDNLLMWQQEHTVDELF